MVNIELRLNCVLYWRQPGLLSWLAALAGGAARQLGGLARLALLGNGYVNKSQ